MTLQGKIKTSPSRPDALVAGVSDAVLRLFDQTAHLHGLTKTWRPMALLSARMAVQREPTGGAAPFAVQWRRAVASGEGVPYGGKRAVQAAWDLLRPAPEPDAVAAAVACRSADIWRRTGLRLAALAQPVLSAGAVWGADAVAGLSVADDGERVLVVVPGCGRVRDAAALDERNLLWNAVMERPLTLVPAANGEARARPLFQPDDGVVRAAACLLLRQMEQFRSREYGLQNRRDPEYVHEMRVATRRMRSLLRTFKAALGEEGRTIKAALKSVARALGGVRDSDVWLAFLSGRVASTQSGRELDMLEALIRSESRRRGRHYVALCDLMAQPAYRRFRDGLHAELVDGCQCGRLPHVRGDAVAEPVHVHAAAALRKGLNACLEYPRSLAKQTPDELHALRIACKELRYMGEFFGCLYDDGLKPLVTTMRQLQSLLGDVHDADVFAARVRRFRERRRSGCGTGGDRLLRMLRDHRARALAKADRVWSAFSRKQRVKDMMRRLKHPKTKGSESDG